MLNQEDGLGLYSYAKSDIDNLFKSRKTMIFISGKLAICLSSDKYLTDKLSELM